MSDSPAQKESANQAQGEGHQAPPDSELRSPTGDDDNSNGEQTHQLPPDEQMQEANVVHDQASLYETEVKEQDRWLPIANVARIMKTALPDNAKIAKEAKECMQECVSEFISFITSEASEKCQVEKRKTVNGEDILFAMFSLGFENYSEALKIYLARYRESNMARSSEQGGRPTSGHGLGSESKQYASEENNGDDGNATNAGPAYGGAQELAEDGVAATVFGFPASNHNGGADY